MPGIRRFTEIIDGREVEMVEDLRKFVLVDGKIHQVRTDRLIESEAYIALPTFDLEIDEEYINQLKPRKDPDYVTEELLMQQPITMFESPTHPGRFFRHDGTHRLFGAYLYLGLRKVPAKWVHGLLWTLFVVVEDINNVTKTRTPTGYLIEREYGWKVKEYDHRPFANPYGPGAHYERNFPHPAWWI